MKILIADDERTARLVTEMALRGLGHDCRSVNDGTQAWDAFRFDRPDVIISDWEMPGMSGLELCRKVRAVSGGGYTYFILVTSRDSLNQILEGMNAGADDYLTKPLRSDHLQVRLIAAARITSLHRQMETVTFELAAIAGRSAELCRRFDFSPDQKPTYGALSPFLVEHRLLLPDGTIRWVRTCGRDEHDPIGAPGRLVGTAQDITVQKTAEVVLIHQAFYDSLSGLPNYALFLDQLCQALEQLGPEPSTLGVIHLNIDRFKVVNDSLGHLVGDQLLLAMADRLSNLIRPADTLARVGGDEFALLCEDMSGGADVVRLADRIRAAMTEPLAWDDGEIVLSVSAGIAVATSGLVSPTALLRDAHAAMCKAKSDGRARSAVFADAMRGGGVGRLDTEMSVRRSIANGDLRVHYQTIVNPGHGEIVGHEALVRWANPTRGLLGPHQFIAVAEESGLIVALGAFVVREACLQAKRFQERGSKWANLTMSVNLSGAQLGQADLIELIDSSLTDAHLRPEYFQLEMTESVLMDDAASTNTVLENLKALGVRLGIDDFGTGYSSLANLKRFPVDLLKIDRSFVDGLGHDEQDSALVAAVIGLAKALHLTSIAEGVETELQRQTLIKLDCPRAQGFLFARPCPAEEAERALDRAAGTVSPSW